MITNDSTISRRKVLLLLTRYPNHPNTSRLSLPLPLNTNHGPPPLKPHSSRNRLLRLPRPCHRPRSRLRRRQHLLRRPLRRAPQQRSPSCTTSTEPSERCSCKRTSRRLSNGKQRSMRVCSGLGGWMFCAIMRVFRWNRRTSDRCLFMRLVRRTGIARWRLIRNQCFSAASMGLRRCSSRTFSRELGIEGVLLIRLLCKLLWRIIIRLRTVLRKAR
jgi:hypothetical protein